jgi:hypothetical protein
MLLICTSAYAVDDNGKVYIRGAGTLSCGSWSIEHKKRSIKSFMQSEWVFGFIGSYNNYVVKGSPGVDEQSSDGAGIEAWVDNYCKKNPLETIYFASQQLIKALAGRTD